MSIEQQEVPETNEPGSAVELDDQQETGKDYSQLFARGSASDKASTEASEDAPEEKDEGEDAEEEVDQEQDVNEPDAQDGDSEQSDEAEASVDGEPEKEAKELDEKDKFWQDKFATTNGKLSQVNQVTAKLIASLEEEGVDREVIAQKCGVSVKAVDNIVNGDMVPGDMQTELQKKIQFFDKSYKGTPDESGQMVGGLKAQVDAVHGEDTQKYVDAYAWKLNNDPEECERFAACSDAEAMNTAIIEGKKALKQYGEVISSEGNVLDLIDSKNARIAELEAQLSNEEEETTEDTPKPKKKTRPKMTGSSTKPAKTSRPKNYKGLFNGR